LKALVEQAPLMMAKSQMLQHSVSAAIYSLKVEKLEALESVLTFFVEFFKMPHVLSTLDDQQAKQNVYNIILLNGVSTQLIHTLLDGCLNTFPIGKGIFEYVGRVFVTWSKEWSDDENMKNAILNEIHTILNAVGDIVTDVEKENLMKKLNGYRFSLVLYLLIIITGRWMMVNRMMQEKR
jgi:hypothetical protein